MCAVGGRFGGVNMPSARTCILAGAAALLASFMLSDPASAQCGSARLEFQNISMESGNPFLADYFTTSSSTLSATASPSHSGLKSVARDSEGRVRVVRSAGKYIVKTSDGVETEMERLSVSIRDPITCTLIVLDTANKSATISAPRSSLPRMIKPGHAQSQSFCTRLFADRTRISCLQTEDLGHQLISGYDAIGLRIRYSPPSATGSESFGSNTQDLWCSDDPGALLSQSSTSESRSGRGFKNESVMQNIERREPEPSLFQVPSDYTVLEPAQSPGPALFRQVLPPSSNKSP